MRHLWLLAVFGCVLTFRHNQFEYEDLSNPPYTIIEGAFDNYVDHVNHMNNSTFKQRYWYTREFWDNKGPIFLFICAEARGGFPARTSLFMELVKRYKGIGVALEHRYYGESFPVPDMKLESMKFLSHTQALADLAHFVTLFKKKFQHEAAHRIKVFCVGGSYAGALSAWARFKYPHVFDGALSSSGVVNAVLDFYEFDEQVRTSVLKSGKECERNILTLLRKVKELWLNDPMLVKKKYRAVFMEWDDFMFYFADIFVIGVQYGRRTQICDFLKTIMNDKNMHEKLSDYGRQIGVLPASYAFKFIRDTKLDEYHNYRQWTYQYCSSLAYFNTPGREVPLRFKEMNLTYWKRYCEKSFLAPVYPDTFHTNTLYGDVEVVNQSSRIIFTNGIEDPWQWAGIRT